MARRSGVRLDLMPVGELPLLIATPGWMRGPPVEAPRTLSQTRADRSQPAYHLHRRRLGRQSPMFRLHDVFYLHGVGDGMPHLNRRPGARLRREPDYSSPIEPAWKVCSS